MTMYKFFRREEDAVTCFLVSTDGKVKGSPSQLKHFFQELPGQQVTTRLALRDDEYIIVGPRLAIETPFSSNACSILQACGIKQVERVERFQLFSRSVYGACDPNELHDRMTQAIYASLPTTFATGVLPDSVYSNPVLNGGMTVLKRVNAEMGLSWDENDLCYFYDLFVNVLRRDPTNVELMNLGNAASDHSRHRTYNAQIIIGGKVMPHTLMDLAKASYLALEGKSNSVVAFCDNASAIAGWTADSLVSSDPTRCSPYTIVRAKTHLTAKVETHNHPTLGSPFDGAATGYGGVVRDGLTIGRGGDHLAASATFCTGNLFLPGDVTPWEEAIEQLPRSNYADPLKIMVDAPAGAWHYGNCYGVPVIFGAVRTCDLIVPVGRDQQRFAYSKPVMSAGVYGTVRETNARKKQARKGMLIVKIGGPALPVGEGGGAASSMAAGSNDQELDFASVQRGNPQMGQLTWRVFRDCVELGKGNPIVTAQDQGAGGPSNNLEELVEKTGGKIFVNRFTCGDDTMSDQKIWCCEYQECYGILIWADRLEQFSGICKREGCPMDVVGEVTNDGKIVLQNEVTGVTSVDLPLKEILSGIPQKTIRDVTPPKTGKKPSLPKGLTVEAALERVLHLPAVASKEFLTRRVDRSVGGKIACQQCCGPLQLPLSDVAVAAVDYVNNSGMAMALGEQPVKTILDPRAGARMSVAEALLNLCFAGITRFSDIAVLVNTMWPAKGMRGETAKLYAATEAVSELLISLGIHQNGGKDSPNMIRLFDGLIVKSPDTLMVTAYAPVPHVARVITPDLKGRGDTSIIHIPLTAQFRLGGSALLQCWNQIGDESPDLDDTHLLKRCFEAVQSLIKKGMVTAGHDISDGGLIAALLEMAFAGNVNISFCYDGDERVNPLAYFFNEEPGLLLECRDEDIFKVGQQLTRFGITTRYVVAKTKRADEIQKTRFTYNRKEVLDATLSDLRKLWRRFSRGMEKAAGTPSWLADWEIAEPLNDDRKERLYVFPKFGPVPTRHFRKRPNVAVIREEGANGDREMAEAFRQAGFVAYDVAMSDLANGKETLEKYRGVVFPGGFSYADVFGAGVGWAKKIQLNPRLQRIFGDFKARSDTFSFGVCNGCQLMARLGWVPFPDLPEQKQPLFVNNESGRFESNWLSLRIEESPAMMLRDMVGSVLGVWVAHGEGRVFCSDESVFSRIQERKLAPVIYCDPFTGMPAGETYPFNPNGSRFGIAGLCDETGRHLAMMPHPERAIHFRTWGWLKPEDRQMISRHKGVLLSPWIKMFQNARASCDETR